MILCYHATYFQNIFITSEKKASQTIPTEKSLTKCPFQDPLNFSAPCLFAYLDIL